MKKSGFTLLEALIASIILVIGIIALSRAFSTGLFVSTDIEDSDLALNIAQAKLEEIKNTAFANLSDSGPTADPNFPNFNVAVDVAEGQDPMRVNVTVGWAVKGEHANITLSTLVTNITL